MYTATCCKCDFLWDFCVQVPFCIMISIFAQNFKQNFCDKDLKDNELPISVTPFFSNILLSIQFQQNFHADFGSILIDLEHFLVITIFMH